MNCPKCGEQNKKGAKFCSSCGESLNIAKIDKNREKPQSFIANEEYMKSRKPTSKPNGCCAAIVIIFIFVTVILMSGYFSASDIKNFSGLISAVFMLGVLAVIFWLSSLAVKKLIKLGLRKWIALLIVVGVLIALLIPCYISYNSYTYNQLAEKVTFIQDKEAEIAAAKLLGDTLILEGAIPVSGVNMPDINSAVAAEKTRLNEVSYPSELQSYVATVNAWADKIVIARDVNSWKALPEAPEKFEILVSNSWIQGLFERTFDDILAIKDAGDWAIQKQDRATMRFVAARLIVIDHFLTSIETYQTVADSGLIESAYADYRTSSGAIMRTRKICFINGKATVCLPEAKEAVKKAKDVAKNLYRFVRPEGYTAVATPQSETGWDDAFTGVLPVADKFLGGAGIGQGEAYVAPQFSPRVQAFRDSCRARGGNPDPTSIIKTRLPTTEDGYNCEIGSCWEFLTYSGRSYAGGGTGCPELGLVPKPPVTIPNIIPNIIPNVNPTPAPVTTSYSGTYSVRYTYGNCGTNIPGFNMGNLGVFNDSITVKNNVASFGNGQNAKIDSNGRAVWSMSVSGATVQQVFNFTKSGGVSGTFTIQVSAQGVGLSCNGSFTGSRL